MVSFHNVRLPEDIEQGAEGGPEFKTIVLERASGREKRNIAWSRVRGSWDIAYGIRTKADLETVRDFFYARQGKAYGFRFKDFSDFEITGPQSIGISGGVTTVFQIYKRYTSGAFYYDRKITRLVNGTYSVYIDGVLKTEGVHYTIDIDTGLVTLASAAGTAATGTFTTAANLGNGDTVTIEGKVYTLQTSLTNVDGHVKIAASETLTLVNLKNAINATGGTAGVDYAAATTANTSVTATSSTAHTVVVKSLLDGTAGNAITTTEASGGAWGAATLTGGVDATVAVETEFDCPVRFDIDKLVVRMTWEDAMEIPSIGIVLLKE
jgi:uncharacterized protein (TIGR02217 family)